MSRLIFIGQKHPGHTSQSLCGHGEILARDSCLRIVCFATNSQEKISEKLTSTGIL